MSMSSNAKNLAVYFLVMAAVAVPMIVIVAPDTMNESKLGLALRVSARLAFLIYVLVFVTRPLQQILSTTLSNALFRNRRYIGIGFAAVMTMHLALIGWLLLFVVQEGRSLASLVPGIITYTLVFLMLLTSFDAPARALGPKNWRRLHKTGLYWIGAIFAVTLVPDVIDYPSDPIYLTIGVLMVLAVIIRVTAFVKGKNQQPAEIVSGECETRRAAAK
jgi:DMSO/TMAO reductase YedYZ heme-binding membrane subunit